MIELTQTHLAPGNCWQTAVACLLDVAIDDLPSQVEIEARGGSYNNALQDYLGKHHGLALVVLRLPVEAYAQLRVVGYHLMIGATERTATNGVHHVVVGRDGEMVWDPHPSRAGLIGKAEWELIVPRPEEWSSKLSPCQCPRCR